MISEISLELDVERKSCNTSSTPIGAGILFFFGTAVEGDDDDDDAD
jgi:hypothetical protein